MIKIILSSLTILIYSCFAFSMESTSGETGKSFVRLVPAGEKTALQLSSKTYENSTNSLKVTLLSAAHFAEPEFYKRHEEIIDRATIVLYEGKGLDKKGFDWRNQPIIKQHERLDSYTLIAKAYDLVCQLSNINYQRNNFVLADYSFDEVMKTPDTFLEEVNTFIEDLKQKYAKEAAENNFSDGFEYFIDLQIKKIKTDTPLQFIATTLLEASQNTEEYLQKNISAEMFEKEFINRNKIVLEEFAKQMTHLQETRHLVIYYGGGHMSYFEEQLCKKYGLSMTSEEWLTAFSY